MYIYGKNSALEALKQRKKIQQIYLFEHFMDKSWEKLLAPYLPQIQYVKKNELDKMVKGNHQGIILRVEDYQYADFHQVLKNSQFLVLLDHIEDPHNLGAIIRTCEAAGVDGIVLPKNRSVAVTDTVLRVSVGTSEYVPICQVTNLVNTMETLKKEGFWIIGTDMAGTDYQTLDYSGKIALVVGSEGSGMARLVTDHCDFIATIPMKGKTNSLNASVAAGIIIFEASSKRK